MNPLKSLTFLTLILLSSLVSNAQDFELPQALDIKGMIDLEGEKISDQIKNSDSVILVLYNPSCGHCHDFIDSTTRMYNKFGNIKFLFIYGDNPEIDVLFTHLSDTYNLLSYKKFLFTKQNSEYFEQFRLTYLPSAYLYNQGRKHKFVKKLDTKSGVYQNFLKDLNLQE